MNPCSQAEKLALVKVLNEADLDPSAGTQGVCALESRVNLVGVPE